MSTILPFPARQEARPAADVTRPCPFCGTIEMDMCQTAPSPPWDHPAARLPQLFFISCPRCKCSGPNSESAGLAAAAWNHRTT